MGLIPEEVDVGENISLRRFLSRGSNTEVLNREFYMSVIEAISLWRKR